jgi:hypothetical protein
VHMKQSFTTSLEASDQPLSYQTMVNFFADVATISNFPKIMLALTMAKEEDPLLADWFIQAEADLRVRLLALLEKLGFSVDEFSIYFLRAIIMGASLMHLQQSTADSEIRAKKIIQAAFDDLKAKLIPLNK